MGHGGRYVGNGFASDIQRAFPHRKDIAMHASIPLLLLIFAFVLFVVAAFNVPSRINLIATGLACWVLSTFIGLL